MSFNSENTVKLSDFIDLFSDVISDCDFFCAAKVGSDIPRRVVYIESESYLQSVYDDPTIVGVILPERLSSLAPKRIGVAISKNPAKSFWALHNKLSFSGNYWEDFDSIIAPSATIHSSAVIAEKNVVLGDNVIVGPNTVIDEKSIIGKNVYIGSSTHIGAPAYELFQSGGLNVVPAQAGGVSIGDGTTIFSCVAIVKSCFPTFTVLEENVSVDNLVHIAHDCRVGAGSKIVATSILCGRVVLGEGVYVGPNATISNGVSMDSNSRASLGSVVTKGVPRNQTVTGNFAINHSDFIKKIKSSSV